MSNPSPKNTSLRVALITAPRVTPTTNLIISRSSGTYSQLDRLLLRSAHFAKRSLLNHQSHNLIKRVGSSHGSKLSISIVRGSHLDDVSSNKVDALKTADDGAELPGGPSTSLGCTGGGSDYLPLAYTLTTSYTQRRRKTYKQDPAYRYQYSSRQASPYQPSP